MNECTRVCILASRSSNSTTLARVLVVCIVCILQYYELVVYTRNSSSYAHMKQKIIIAK